MTDGPDDRPSAPDRPRPTFLPPEDPVEQPVWEPAFPAGQGSRSAMTLPVVIVTVLVLVVAGGWFVTRNDGLPAPTPTTTAVAAVRFRRLPPPCSTVSAPTVRRLVQDAATLSGPAPAQAGRVTARCAWDDSYDPRKRQGFRDQALKVDLTAHLSDSVMSGLESARIGFDSRRDVYRQTAKETDTTGRFFAYGPLLGVPGLGDEAFSTYNTVSHPALGEQLPSTATITIRISNAVVDVTYSATDQRGTPLADRAAREAAETAARDVTGALLSCRTCSN